MSLRARNERGSASLECVIGIPSFLLLAAVIFVGGRIAVAQQVIQSAASDAARSASIARTAGVAKADATQAAHTSMAAWEDLSCVNTTVVVDTTGFATEVGTAAQIEATVSCDLPLAHFGVPGLAGTKTISATMSSPLDTHRERR